MTTCMSSAAVRVGLGLAIVVGGVALVFSPEWVRDTLARPAETIAERINLRATFGGAVVGLGAWVAHASGFSPWKTFLAKGVLWLMVGVGAARTVGFALDGKPDTMQWVWLSAEIILAVGAGLFLRRRAVSERAPQPS